MVTANNPLVDLKGLGQSVWLDSIHRGQIVSGGLKKLIEEDGLTGETANPTLFEKAIVGGSDYDEAIHRMQGKTPLETYEALAVEDVRMAADIFRPVYDETQGADGFVSLEVSPKLAHDTRGSIAEARRFFTALDRPNVMIKIPGTVEGVPAVEECLYRGININITLLFSIHAYERVAWAYVRALERRAAEGKSIDRVASVASFFVSRIDTLADKLIDEKLRSIAEPEGRARITALRGQVAIANAKLAYQSFLKIAHSPRFHALKQKGARLQRPLWASTSTKDPRYPDLLYVEALIGPDTVNTLPLETINAYRDHGRPHLTLQEGLDKAEQVLHALAEAGLSLDAITQQVLDEGVEKFDASLAQLLRGIQAKRVAPTAPVGER
jgi:transaldolase